MWNQQLCLTTLQRCNLEILTHGNHPSAPQCLGELKPVDPRSSKLSLSWSWGPKLRDRRWSNIKRAKSSSEKGLVSIGLTTLNKHIAQTRKLLYFWRIIFWGLQSMILQGEANQGWAVASTHMWSQDTKRKTTTAWWTVRCKARGLFMDRTLSHCKAL